MDDLNSQNHAEVEAISLPATLGTPPPPLRAQQGSKRLCVPLQTLPSNVNEQLTKAKQDQTGFWYLEQLGMTTLLFPEFPGLPFLWVLLSCLRGAPAVTQFSGAR